MNTRSRPPSAPKGLGASGRRLWRSVSDDYELDVHEELVLLQACRCADRLDTLAAQVADAPPMVTTSRGDEAPHPALVESRQQSVTLTRLLASLRLPSGETGPRPQRRGAARGTYDVARLPVRGSAS
jgi:hypothetical protein